MVESSVGPYRILEKIGSGGMGDVYLAEDTRLRRRVALKSLAEAWLKTPGARERLLREARSAATLNHPNIAAIYDVVEAGDRTHIVMEYVQGESLSHRLLRGRLPPEQVSHIALQLCDAMAAAHAAGVIHRDLKPGNVSLTSDGKVKVLDFGLATTPPGIDAEPVGPTDTTPSKGERILGTPAYMAPEQLRHRPIDHRTDIYSSGVMLYELLTGRRPFKGDGAVELGLAILTQPIPSPAEADPSLPLGLSDIVARAMAREPADRFQSAVAMREALRRLPPGISDQTTLASIYGLKTDRVHHSRWKRALLVAGPLAALGGLLLFANPARWATPSVAFGARDWLLICDFANTTGEAVFDESLREGLTVALNQSAHVNVFPRPRIVDALKRMKRDPASAIDAGLGRELCRREGIKLLLTGGIRQSGGTFQIAVQAVEPGSGRTLLGESEQFTAKEEVFERVDRLARRLREALGESAAAIEQKSRPLARATTRSLEALELYSKAREVSAQGDVKAAAALLRKALEVDPDFAMAHRQLGSASLVLGDPAEAGRRYARAFELRHELTDRERLLITASHHRIRNEFEEAAEALKVLVSLYPDDLDAHEELAIAYDSTAQVPKAIDELREVLRLDPYATQAYGNLGLFLVTVGSFRKAIDLYDEAARRGLKSPYFGWGLGLARLALGETNAARDHFRALEQAGPPYQALGQLYLARAAIYEGKFEEAREQLAAGLRSDLKTNNEPSASLRRVLRAQLSWLEGRRSAVQVDLEPVLRAEPGDLAYAQLRDAGQLLARMGDTRRARQALQRLRELGGSRPDASNRSSLRTVEGEIELSEGRASQAVELFLAAATEYPLHFSQLGLARAYEAQRDWRRAAEAWHRILEARGEILRFGFPADAVLAHWQLARAQQKLGDAAPARASYEAFLGLWKNGETLPLRERAAREWRALGGASPSAGRVETADHSQ